MWRIYERGAQIEKVYPEMQQLLQSLFNSIIGVKEKFHFYTTGDRKSVV